LSGALSSGPFRTAVTGHILSATARSLPVVALTVYTYDRTGSAGWVAAAAAVRLLPPILFPALAGVLGDRHDRRSVLVAGNVGAAAAAGVVALLAAVGAPVTAVLVGSFVVASIATVGYPAMVASTPQLVPPGRFVAAATVVSTVESAAFMVGPGLGGLGLVVSSPASVLAVDALLFLAAAAVTARTPPWDRGRREATAPSPLRRQLRQGWDGCASAEARSVVVVLLATELLYGCTIVLLVLVAAGPGTAGLLNAFFAAGAFSAVLVAGPMARGNRPAAVLATSTLASGLPLVVLAVTGSLPVAFVLLAGAGVASTVVEVQAKTLLQQVVGVDVMARVFGLLAGAGAAAILAGSVLTPVLVAAVGPASALVVVGAVLPGAALAPLARRGVAMRMPRASSAGAALVPSGLEGSGPLTLGMPVARTRPALYQEG
jgi:ENTS family enterobactin (siderophore) exporter